LIGQEKELKFSD
jgi:hypothetical protein